MRLSPPLRHDLVCTTGRGTRYSTNVTSGQCDGKADAPYPGSGVNKHCAFKDVRYLWSDGSYTYGKAFPGWGWIGSGGDTYIIRGSIGTGVAWRVGWNSAATYCDPTGCWGLTGDAIGSGAPPPPSGTATQHTRILGRTTPRVTAPRRRRNFTVDGELERYSLYPAPRM